MTASSFLFTALLAVVQRPFFSVLSPLWAIVHNYLIWGCVVLNCACVVGASKFGDRARIPSTWLPIPALY